MKSKSTVQKILEIQKQETGEVSSLAGKMYDKYTTALTNQFMIAGLLSFEAHNSLTGAFMKSAQMLAPVGPEVTALVILGAALSIRGVRKYKGLMERFVCAVSVAKNGYIDGEVEVIFDDLNISLAAKVPEKRMP